MWIENRIVIVGMFILALAFPVYGFWFEYFRSHPHVIAAPAELQQTGN